MSNFQAVTYKNKYDRYLKSLKYSLYVITHPIDGFWDLTHEKRGSYLAASTILFLTIFVRLLRLKYTSFIFMHVYWEELNILTYIMSILLPVALFVVGNWALTTLFDGKGRLGQVYIATCYALTPYPLIQFPLMIFSNFITVDEAEFYSVLAVLPLVWVGFLLFLGMGQIHEFSFGKNILFMIFSLGAMLIMVFLILLFFSMVTQGVSYFISLGRELLYRM